MNERWANERIPSPGYKDILLTFPVFYRQFTYISCVVHINNLLKFTVLFWRLIYVHILCCNNNCLTFPVSTRQFTFISWIVPAVYLHFPGFHNNLLTFPVFSRQFTYISCVVSTMNSLVPVLVSVHSSLKRVKKMYLLKNTKNQKRFRKINPSAFVIKYY